MRGAPFSFTGSEAVYGDRVGAAALEAERGAERLPVPEGHVVRTSGNMALQRRLNGARSLGSNSVEAQLPRGGFYCDTPEKLAYWVGVLDWLKPRVGQLGGSLAGAEEATRKRAGFQRGGIMGWDVMPRGLALTGGQGMEEAFRIMGRWPVWSSFEVTPASMPLLTNTGAPTYEKGLVHALLHRLLVCSAGGSWSKALDLYAWAADMLGSDPAIHAILFTRAGPVHKKQFAYDLRSGSVDIAGTLAGYACSRRHVFGVPRFINEMLVGYVTGVKDCLVRLSPFNHTTPDEAKRRRIGPRKWLAMRVRAAYVRARLWWGRAIVRQDDIKAYDKSVRPVHHDSLQRFYASMWGDEPAAMWREAQKMGVLGPAWGSSDRDGFMYERSKGGVTTSGIISTSMDGCIINYNRVLTTVAAACGWTLEEAERYREEGRWAVFIWGDDTLLILPPFFNEDVYRDTSKAIGFECALDEAPVFLMTYVDVLAGEGWALGTRVLANRVFPERAPPVGILRVLAAADSIEALRGNALQQDIWDLISYDPELKSRAVTDIASLRALLTSEVFKSEMKKVATGTNTTALNVQEWLSDFYLHGLGAETGAAALLEALGPTVGTRKMGPLTETVSGAEAMFRALVSDLSVDRASAKRWKRRADILSIVYEGPSFDTEEEEEEGSD